MSATQGPVGSDSVLYPLKKLNAQDLADLKAELRQLPASSTPVFPYGERRQLVADLLEEILFLREQGYSYSEISDLLNEKTDVLIHPKTLRRYFFEEQAKQRGTAGRTRRPKRSQIRQSRSAPRPERSTPAIQPDSCPAPAPEPEPEPVPVAAEAPEPEESRTPANEPAVKPEAEPQSSSDAEALASPVETVADDDWGGWDEDDDDSYTSGLLNEPTFNRIPRR